MITLETPTGLHAIALEREAITPAVARRARVTQAGVLVVEGDGGQDPTPITVRLRARDTSADSVAAAQALLAAAEAATALHRDGQPVTYLEGLARSRMLQRPTWWQLELTWLPRLLDGGSGTGELVTFGGEDVTLDGLPAHMDEGADEGA